MSGIQLRIFGFGYLVFSEKDACFLFFAGTVFQEWHCVPFPLRMRRYGKRGATIGGCKPPCIIIGYPYTSPYPVFLKTPLLQRAFMVEMECRGGYSEQVAKFPFAHGGCANVGRQGDVAVAVRCDDASFHGYAWLWGYTSERCVQFVAEHRQVIVEFLRGYLRVDLSRDNVRVSQNTVTLSMGIPLLEPVFQTYDDAMKDLLLYSAFRHYLFSCLHRPIVDFPENDCLPTGTCTVRLSARVYPAASLGTGHLSCAVSTISISHRSPPLFRSVVGFVSYPRNDKAVNWRK